MGGTDALGGRSTRSVVASLVLGVFLGGVGGGVAFPTLPALGPVLGISTALVGVILAANRFIRLLASTPAGGLLDAIGTRRPMIAGFLAMGLAPFGYALGLIAPAAPAVGVPVVGAVTPAAATFLVSRVVWGIGSAFVFVGTFSTITHATTPENRGRWIGYARGGQSLGFPTGLVVGGLVADAAGYAAAFLAAGGAGLVAAVAAVLVLPDVRPDVDPSGMRDLPDVVAADPRIAGVGLVNLLVRFVYAGVLLSTAVLYARRHDLRVGSLSGTGVSGVVMAVSVVTASLATVVVGRVSDGLDNRAPIALPALAVLGVGFGLLVVRPTLPATLAAVALIGLGVGGTNPPLLAYLGDISPADDVGKLGGVYNVFGDVGSTLGPVVALPLASAAGPAAGYLLCAGLAVLGGVLVAGTLLGPATPPGAAPADD